MSSSTVTVATPRTAHGRRRTRKSPAAIAIRIILAIVYVIPLLWIVLTSFKDKDDVIGSSTAIFFQPTLDAYRAAFTPELLAALGQSLVIATTSTAIVLAVAIPAAYGLARVRGVLPTIGLSLLIVLQMVPQTATVIPFFQVFGGLRLLDTNLAVILADAALMTPFAIILLRPFFRAVPPALEEAASVDGARSFRIFWSIVLPVVRNGVATTATLVFLIVWGEFLYAVNFFLTPGNYPLSALLAQQVSSYGINWPGLMALGVITSLPILVLFSFTYRLLKEGLTVGAVK
ncbi:carbohydrate ABC transporter permease [Herbiconiux sp. CPCC 205716]|uniref:Carbohydrate ABC transporter permease n=1 Tax=Herbiconiux gentiana TaxID=2970912 RepID=A0ABT2GJQ1_9MICO|nr:carbohydrate ABC transporter permease [Herbiconiux gentiana]MCS5716457.1 carbohydrate ABC transporter permease [Herbiconiux gentiana]